MTEDTTKKYYTQEEDIDRNLKVIRFWKTGNYTQTALGRMFKINRSAISRIIKRWSNDPINEPEEHDGKI